MRKKKEKNLTNNLFINFIMSIYSRNADPILKLVAITPRTFF
jgi:hypothetical protein